MQKFAILSIITVSIILGTAISGLQLSHSQQDTTTTATNTSTNFTKLFSENKEYQQCFSLGTTSCFPTIEVLYQSPSTIALKADTIDVIWKAVDVVKKEGYNIDDITSFAVGGGSSLTPSQTINILVVMSK